MNEKIDPYFAGRLEQASRHRVIKSIKVENASQQETEPNKELPHPVVEGEIEEFGWSERSVENIIKAIEDRKIKVERIDQNHIRIEFLPLNELPEQLGHVSELSVIQNNLKRGMVFGSSDPDQFTYLQTTDFAVEGYIDDESEGRNYGRIYADSLKLAKKRNVYIDPESLHVTDYEYGHSFCVQGGLPLEAITRIDVIKARKIPPEEKRSQFDASGNPDDMESYVDKQAARLREYLDRKLGG